MKKNPWIIVLMVSLLAAAGLLLAGCAKEETPAAAANPQELVFSVPAEVSLDPQHTWSTASTTLGSYVMEGLVRVHDGQIQPGMAETWEVSPDGKTYTFHLRDTVWSDGSPVTAQDFEFGFRRLLDPSTAAEYAWAAYYIVNAEEINSGKITDLSQLGVKALDEKTLQIQLINPAPYYLGYMNFSFFYPVKESYLAEAGSAFGGEADKLLYNGPFILTEWNHEQDYVMEKNPNYWNKDAIKLDKVQALIITDPTTAFNMYESGELDIVNIPLNMVEQYLAEGTGELRYTGADDWIKLNLKTGPEILKNLNFRKALNFALDRESYIQTATKGVYAPANRMILPMVSGLEKKFTEEYPLDFYPIKGDVTKAQEYLKQAMTEMNIANAADITIEYLIQDDENTRIMAEALQDIYRRNLGINFVIKQVPYKQKLAQDSKLDFQMVYQGWAPDYDDPMTYLELWTSNSSYNSGWVNAQYDELIKFAKSSTDPQARADAMAEAEKVILEDAAFVPLQFRREAWTKKDYVQGVVRSYIGPDPDVVYASIEGEKN